MRPISWKGTVGNRSQLELQGEQPLTLALVRHTYLGHGHGLIIPTSKHLSRRQGPVGAFNTNPRGFYTHVSIHCQNAYSLRCGTEAREKKYNYLLVSPLTLILLSKNTSRRSPGYGPIPPVFTCRRQPSWAIRMGRSTYPLLTARHWKYPKSNYLQTT